MSSDSPFEQASELICSEFSLPSVSLGLQASEPLYEQLRRLLAGRVEELLHGDYERLMAALYRIDVDERLAQEALRERRSAVAADRLAALIIDRQLEKAELRRRRREG